MKAEESASAVAKRIGSEVDLADPAEVGLSAPRLARIGPWMSGYIDRGKLPGALTLVARRGRVVYLNAVGLRDVEREQALEPSTLFRMYSMTKPIASAALLMLYEEARFHLDDPVSRFIPGFADLRVFESGSPEAYRTVPLERPMTVRHLLTHTSGLTYDFLEDSAVSALYRAHRLRHVNGDDSLERFVERLREMPLLCQPGAEWNYSVSTDVVGYLVQLLSNRPFEEFLRERIFAPLDMQDTGFSVPAGDVERFAACYTTAGPGGGLRLTDDPVTSRFTRPPTFHSGGGGLVSTARDYWRFAQMLANRGALEGERLLGRKTVEYMTTNHLPGDMASMGQPTFSETSYEGIGFGLGVSVVLDPPATQTLQSVGTYAWGGMASTAFWVDPREDVVVVFLTQLTPSSAYPVRNELRVLVNQAIVD